MIDSNGVQYPNITCPRCRARHPAHNTCEYWRLLAAARHEARGIELAADRRKVTDSMERRFSALREAEILLGLVAAEFESDPMSVQCFDLRIVERVKACAKTLRDNPDLFAR